MKFLDHTKIKVTAGKGGDGFISFRREAHVDKGGPDGGDGGNGGSVYFIGDKGLNTLLSLHYKRIIKGNDGVKGGRKNLYGANGSDIFVKIPFGTQVFLNNKIIADIIEEQPYLICKGGKGGKGNAKFKTARNSAPRLSENGMPGQSYEVSLELKVLADVGCVGVPNAGKSSLLSVISNAKPKIANYQFTTINPQLGLVEHQKHSFVIADLPGLIAGASLGKGMGLDFLRHIERCKIIAHVIDFSLDYEQIVSNYHLINNELKNYKIDLLTKQQLIVANKNDEIMFADNFAKFKKEYDVEIVSISALAQTNLKQLKAKLWTMIEQYQAPEIKVKDQEVYITYDKPYIVTKHSDYFEISGSKVKYWYERIPMNSTDNWLRFNKILQNLGVWDRLYELGIKSGDTVKIFDYTFEWSE